MKEIKLPKLKCKRCGHEWTPRTKMVIICPHCRSAYWDREKREISKKLEKQSKKRLDELEIQGRA